MSTKWKHRHAVDSVLFYGESFRSCALSLLQRVRQLRLGVGDDNVGIHAGQRAVRTKAFRRRGAADHLRVDAADVH